jgi:signal peptidase I
VSDLSDIPTLPEITVPPPQRANVKRHLIAAGLSTVVPGAGQFFLGRNKKAGFLFLALITISGGFWPLRLPRFYVGLIFLLWMCLLLSLFAVFDALLARDTRSSGRMSRWWIFAGIPLHYIGVNLIFTSLLIGSGFRAFKFASTSMEPTLFAGDKFVFDKRYYQGQPVRRGDLVVMRIQDSFTVKRIIAIGGDTIQGKDREILLNDSVQSEPFIEHKWRAAAYAWMDTFGPVAIPSGKFFVMGDNRDISLDSRSTDFGLVDARSIVGKPLYGYQIIGKPHTWELN